MSSKLLDLVQVATDLIGATIYVVQGEQDKQAPATLINDLVEEELAPTVNALATLNTDITTLRQRRNRLVNPAMQVSQENSNTAGTTSAYYGADQFATYFVTSAGTITTQRVQSTTPGGALDRYRVTITTADASLAAGEYLTITQNLEGQNVADFRYGSASAKQSVLRFGFKGPAGTYAARLGNSATDQSYVALFTIAAGEANTDTVQTFTIAGDTTGTWLTTSGIGITLDIVLAAGSTFQGTTGWQSGNILGTSGVSNGMGTGSAVFEVFDTGLYLDAGETGVAPRWELPDEAVERMRSYRYYWEMQSPTGGVFLVGNAAIIQDYRTSHWLTPVDMRMVPTTSATWADAINILSHSATASLNFVRFDIRSNTTGRFFEKLSTLKLNARLS